MRELVSPGRDPGVLYQNPIFATVQVADQQGDGTDHLSLVEQGVGLRVGDEIPAAPAHRDMVGPVRGTVEIDSLRLSRSKGKDVAMRVARVEFVGVLVPACRKDDAAHAEDECGMPGTGCRIRRTDRQLNPLSAFGIELNKRGALWSDSFLNFPCLPTSGSPAVQHGDHLAMGLLVLWMRLDHLRIIEENAAPAAVQIDAHHAGARSGQQAAENQVTAIG